MTTQNKCQLIPHDAKLDNFNVIGELKTHFIWNEDTELNDIVLLDDIIFIDKKRGFKLIVRKGFRCDGGSVPQSFWTTIYDPYATRALLSFILHDALYASRLFQRDESDTILLEFLMELGSCWLKRNKIWSGVRIWGDRAWNDRTEEDIAIAEQYVQKIPIV